jgi:hypothetical protein
VVETRRLVAHFGDGAEPSRAFQRSMADNAAGAFVPYHELDFFEQLAALGRQGAIDFRLIERTRAPVTPATRDAGEGGIPAHREGGPLS